MNQYKRNFTGTCACVTIAFLGVASEAGVFKPDALLSIDLNRNAVVEKIVSAWQQEIPTAQRESFKTKLQGLRADHLLSANVSGSFESVLEVLHANEARQENSAKSAIPAAQKGAYFQLISENSGAEKAKALGDTAADLVYTPIVPCRVFDTRTPGTPFVANGSNSGVIQVLDMDGTNLSAQGGAAAGCNIPTSARAVVLAFSPITPPTTGWFIGAANDGTPMPASTLFNYSSALTLTTFTAIIPMLGQAGGDIRLEARGVAAYSVHGVGDVTGYFKAPGGTIGDITEIQTAAGSGLAGGVVSGIANIALAPAYKLPQSCATGQVAKFNSGIGLWECATETGSVTSVATGAGLSGGPIISAGTISLASSQLLPTTPCALGQSLQWNGTAWACAASVSNTVPSCLFGETIAVGLGGQLQCGIPNTFVPQSQLFNGLLLRGSDGLPMFIPYGLNGQNGVVKCTNARCFVGSVSTSVSFVAPDFYFSVGAAAVTGDGFPIFAGVTSRSPTGAFSFLKCGNANCTSSSFISTGLPETAKAWSMATAGDGFALLLFTMPNAGNAALYDVKLLKCGNASCSAFSTVAITTLSANVYVHYASMAVGADGLPVVVFGTTGTSGVAWPSTFVKCTTVACATPTITAAGSFASISKGSIVVPSDGLPVLLITELAGALQTIKCAAASCNTQLPPVAISSEYGRQQDSYGLIAPDGKPLFLTTRGSANAGFTLIKCGDVGCSAGNSTNTRPWSGQNLTSLGLVLSGDGMPLIMATYGGFPALMKCVDLLCTGP
jgi:hypothetical protein